MRNYLITPFVDFPLVIGTSKLEPCRKINITDLIVFDKISRTNLQFFYVENITV